MDREPPRRTVLTLAGFHVTAATTLRARRWTGLQAWLTAAAAIAAVLALQPTWLLPSAVGVCALSFLAPGLALDQAPQCQRPSADAEVVT